MTAPHMADDDLSDKLEMSKNRDKKVFITDEAVSKVPRIQYREIDPSEYDIIQVLTQAALETAKNENDSNEVAITYSLDSRRLAEEDRDYFGVSLGDEHDVDPLSDPTSYHLIMDSAPCLVVIMHNHPSLSKISLADIRFLLQYASLKMIVVVSNLGAVSYLVKTDRYDYKKARDVFREAAEIHNKCMDASSEKERLKGFTTAVKHFINNCHRAGLIYEDR